MNNLGGTQMMFPPWHRIQKMAPNMGLIRNGAQHGPYKKWSPMWGLWDLRSLTYLKSPSRVNCLARESQGYVFHSYPWHYKYILPHLDFRSRLWRLRSGPQGCRVSILATEWSPLYAQFPTPFIFFKTYPFLEYVFLLPWKAMLALSMWSYLWVFSLCHHPCAYSYICSIFFDHPCFVVCLKSWVVMSLACSFCPGLYLLYFLDSLCCYINFVIFSPMNCVNMAIHVWQDCIESEITSGSVDILTLFLLTCENKLSLVFFIFIMTLFYFLH